MSVTLSSSIGNSPLLSLQNLCTDCEATIFAKQESRNPMGSVKDRIALAMIEAGRADGKIKTGTTVIEATSGNTGLGLAFICASQKLSLILTMPESMSIERRALLKHLGAELFLTPAAKGMKGAMAAAEELHLKNKNSFMVRQFENPANPKIHETTTAEEIWHDTAGKIDIFVAGIGTGGTFTGVMTALKKKNPKIIGIAVEPADSPVLSGGNPAPHKIQGIGAGFIPKIMNINLIDSIITVSNDNAFATARLLASEEGILAGISSGAAVFAALQLAKKKENSEKIIVTILPDTGERYLSTPLYRDNKR